MHAFDPDGVGAVAANLWNILPPCATRTLDREAWDRTVADLAVMYLARDPGPTPPRPAGRDDPIATLIPTGHDGRDRWLCLRCGVIGIADPGISGKATLYDHVLAEHVMTIESGHIVAQLTGLAIEYGAATEGGRSRSNYGQPT